MWRDSDRDIRYSPLLIAVTRVALALFVVKIASSALVAHALGVDFGLNMWRDAIPTIGFRCDRSTFVEIVGWSSMLTSITALAGFIILGYRSNSTIRCFAWLTGFIAIFDLIALDAILNQLHPPRISTPHLLASTAVCVAGLVTAFVLLGRRRLGFVEQVRESLTASNPLEVRLHAPHTP